MAELKTKKTAKSVTDFLNVVEPESKRKDAFELHGLMQEVTGDQGSIWGDSIVGYGHYHYKYESGRENDWFLCGFSPRKTKHSVYIMAGFERFNEILSRLGKHKTSKGCLYINKLADIDMAVLKELVEASTKNLQEKYGEE